MEINILQYLVNIKVGFLDGMILIAYVSDLA